MDIHTNIPLTNYLTMRIGGAARFMSDVFSVDDVRTIVANTREQNLPLFVLGGGSNVIAHDELYNGVVVRNRIPGFEKIAEDSQTATFKIGAGETWDDIVAKTVEQNLIGIEAMSAIPGTCGAAPVQNIGAYGQEVADTLVELEAFDATTDEVVTITNEQCKFSYRDSIFRNEEKGRYIILSVTLELYKAAPKPPFYKALQDYFDTHNITLYTPSVIRKAVTAIRAEKLPDPTIKPNAGSFFKNAMIEQWLLDELLATYPDMPHYDMGEKIYKVPTGWLIEQCDLKDTLHHGMRVNPANALVLINESATGYNDLARAREAIQDAVRDTFRISIEQEPLELA
ncbi:MAG: UDP-N-acetylmuramate dehydrogenase [Candidatus Saccharimonadales bacterium]